MAKEDAPAIPREFVTTLQAIPGYVIESHLGVIAIVVATAGMSAQEKATHSISESMKQLRTVGLNRGGNAVLGLHMGPFGASIGGVMGDAVGMVLLGTLVVVKGESSG
ncbi:MAG: hypothetical protein ACR2FE_08820 [Aeromicrobium sp.]